MIELVIKNLKNKIKKKLMKKFNQKQKTLFNNQI